MKNSRKFQEQSNQQLGLVLLLGSLGLLSILLGLTEAEGMESIIYTLLGILLIFGMFILLFLHKKKKEKELEANYIEMLYKFLEKNNYKTTVIEFASFSGLPPDKAREVIENVAIKTGISPEIDEEGRIFYKF